MKKKEFKYQRRKPLFRKSRLFLRIFLSYLAFILAFLLPLSLSVIASYQSNKKRESETLYEAQTSQLGTFFDNEFVQAKNIAVSINYSTAVKNVYTQSALFNTSVDSYLYTQMKNEMTSILAQRENIALSQIMIVFNNSNRVYTSSSVISLASAWQNAPAGSGLALDTVSSLLETENQNVLMQTEYLIYYADYSYSSNGVSRGTIFVLLSPDILEKLILEKLPNLNGFQVMTNGNVLLESGNTDGDSYTCISSVDETVSYCIYVPKEKFWMPDTTVILTLLTSLICGFAAATIAWRISFRQYLPYEHIMQMVKPDENIEIKDGDTVVRAMQDLITEKNEISEKMVEIRPYAQKGMLQDAMHGNLPPENLTIFYQDSPGELKSLYFAVAVVNLTVSDESGTTEKQAFLLQQSEDLIKKMSDDMQHWYCYVRDRLHLYAIVNFDDIPDWEEPFYHLHRELSKITMGSSAVTIGVSCMKDDVAHLRDAYSEADDALTYMITGGRGQVFFYEPGMTGSEKDYYFPVDAEKLLTQLLRRQDTGGIAAFFADLLEKNTRQHEVTAASMESLVDELHMTTIHIIRDLGATQDMPVTVRKVPMPATIEEILSYYQNVFETVILHLPQLVNTDESVEACREQILQYIDSHYLDKDLSLQQLTGRFHVSKKFVSALCNASYGKNYLQYVQEKRICYAKDLLRTGSYSIEEVAERSGYSSTLTFRRNFKAILGMNPSDYADRPENEKQ
ncbi:MAG: helix-turn-helix domain-containing protein [Clostridiales bacterium]|nr:helix-turn-helix domain-containing protein [Clostridiales bacterium]